MVARILAFVLLTALLSGCSGSQPSTTLSSSSSASSSSSSASTTLQTSLAASEPALANATAACDSQRTAVGTNLGYGASNDPADACHFDAMLDVNVTDYSAALVEITWSQTQATETEVRASLQSDLCTSSLVPGESCTLAAASGATSPLRLELTKVQVVEHGGHDLAVAVGFTGAAVQHAFTVHVTLFNSARIPSGYTAVP